jgi:hypothetical protein
VTARRPRRLAALLSVVPVLVAAAAVAAAPPASAATTATLGCRVYFYDSGAGSTNNPPQYPDTFTWQQSGSTFTLSGADGITAAGPAVAKDQVTVRVSVEWAGGGSAELVSGGYPSTDVASGAKMGSWSASGTIDAPAGTTLTVKRIRFDDSTSINVDVYCSAQGDRDHKSAPVATPITTTVAASTGSPTGSSSGSPTGTGSPTPTGTGSPTPTGTGSPTPTNTGSPTTSASPTTSTTPPSTDVEPVTVTGLYCEIPGRPRPGRRRRSRAAPPRPTQFSFGADKLTVTKGQKVNFTLTFDQGPAVGPVTIPKGALKPMAKVKVSGAGTGTAILVGPVNTADIVGYAAGTPTGWNEGQTLKGSFTATADGTVTAVLEEVAFDYGDTTAGASFGWPTTVEDLDSVCNKGSKPKTAAVSIALEAQEGTVPTASPTASTSTSTTTTDGTDDDTDGSGDDGNNGTLAATGPGEAFQAMIWALVALQVGLIIVVRMARRRPVAASASSTRSARRRTPGQPWARPRGRHR